MSADETPAPDLPDLIGAARGALGEECLQDAKCGVASELEPAVLVQRLPGARAAAKNAVTTGI